jgi:hypothetical protein
MPTATFSGDFEDFYKACTKAESHLKLVQKETDKTSAATEGMAETFTVSAGEVNKTSSQFSQFNDILGAVGIHLGPIPKALDEVSAASGKTAGSLGTLATAGLALGAAMAGWKIGRIIADFTGSDKIIGDAAASLLGWTTAAGGAGSAADTLARASAAAGRSIVSMDEAIKINTQTIRDAQSVWARSRAPEEAAKMVAGYHTELEALRKSGVLDDLKRDLEANIIPQQALAKLYGVSAGALGILNTELAAHKERVDRINEANQKQVDLQNQLFGRELTAKAREYATAIGDISNVSKLLPDQMKTVNETFIAAANHLTTIGLGASEAAKQFRDLAVATTDWAAVNKAVAASPDPFVAANAKRRAAYRDLQNDQMNLNQGVFDGAAEWMHAGEIADKAMADAAAGTEATTAAVTTQIGQVNSLAASFTILNQTADQWRAKAAQLYQDAARNERTQGGVSFFSPTQIAQDQRAVAGRALESASRQEQLDRMIGSMNAPWTRNNAGMTITVNAMQGIDGDQIAGALVTGMRQRGIGLGG